MEPSLPVHVRFVIEINSIIPMFNKFLMFPFRYLKVFAHSLKRFPLALFFKTNSFIILFLTHFWFILYSMKTYYSVFIFCYALKYRIIIYF